MARFASIAAFLVCCACATGGEDAGPPGDDGGGMAEDAGPGRDTGPRRDTGPAGCPSGQHACGAGCVDDQPNDPANGCSQSCGGDPCDTPAGAMAACTAEGECTWECLPPAVREGDTCSCAARTCLDAGAQCGMIDDACGSMIDCGGCTDGTCQPDNTCGCTPDSREPNERHTLAPDMGDLHDVGDDSDTIAGMNLHRAGDVDWYFYDIFDDCCDGNPIITVTLDNIPSASDYQLAAYFVCSSTAEECTCLEGDVDNSIGNGCNSSNAGAAPETVEIDTGCNLSDSEDGRVFIRVTAASWATTCAPYRLQVNVR